jgi:hypothetical protein
MKIKPNDPYFAAYTQLTLFANYQRSIKDGTKFVGGKSKDFSFKQFNELLKENKVVNKENAGEMSKFHKDALQIQMNYSKDLEFTLKVKDIISKAFQLGLVDKDQTLINKMDTKA